MASNAAANHYGWKGDSVGYRQAHAWVRREFLKDGPLTCSKCGGTKRVEIANVTGNITRDKKDYTPLCKRCHNYFDGQIYLLKQGEQAIRNSVRNNPDMTHKGCTQCGALKSLDNFYKDGDSIRAECKECTKENHKVQRRRRIV